MFDALREIAADLNNLVQVNTVGVCEGSELYAVP
jgi:hypothetical protein